MSRRMRPPEGLSAALRVEYSTRRVQNSNDSRRAGTASHTKLVGKQELCFPNPAAIILVGRTWITWYAPCG